MNRGSDPAHIRSMETECAEHLIALLRDVPSGRLVVVPELDPVAYARLRLAMRMDARTKLRALVEGWDYGRIVHECY